MPIAPRFFACGVGCAHYRAQSGFHQRDGQPALGHGPDSPSEPQDEAAYELAPSVALSPDGTRTDVFWVHVQADARSRGLNLTLVHRQDAWPNG